MNTLRVYWRDKFDGKVVTIDAATFDPSLHRHEADGKWPSAEAKAITPEPVKVEAPVEAPPAVEAKPKAKTGTRSKK